MNVKKVLFKPSRCVFEAGEKSLRFGGGCQVAVDVRAPCDFGGSEIPGERSASCERMDLSRDGSVWNEGCVLMERDLKTFLKKKSIVAARARSNSLCSAVTCAASSQAFTNRFAILHCLLRFFFHAAHYMLLSTGPARHFSCVNIDRGGITARLPQL